jgi:hypothetical protein
MTSIQRRRLLGSFLAHVEMKNVERYIARGRCFARLSDHDLDSDWITAWRKTLLDPEPHPLNADHDALCAELHLRGRPYPTRLIDKEERREIRARIVPLYAAPELQAELEDQLREFFKSWGRPCH